MSLLLGVCGYSGAGKTTFCREMGMRFHLPVLSSGETVRRIAEESGRELTPAEIARVSEEIRRQTGGRFMRLLEPDLRWLFRVSPTVLLDGLREEADLLTLREITSRVVLVAITAPEEVRASRALGRGRPGDPANPAELQILHETEHRLGVSRLLEIADYRVANDGDLPSFLERSAAVVEEILAANG